MAKQYTLAQKMSAEAIGTFFLVFVGAGTAAMTLILNKGAPRYTVNNAGIGALGGSSNWLTIALAFAFVIMTMIYVFGPISGAHVNPAVTLSVWIRGKMTGSEAVGYWIAQFAGGTAGAFAIALIYGKASWLVGGLGASAPFPQVPLWRAGVAEFLGTFGLVLGVHGLALSKKAPEGWAGAIIGLNIAGLILVTGNVSGAGLNPARTVGPIIANWVLGGPILWNILGVYLVAEAIGGIAAALLYPAMANLTKPARNSAAESLSE